MKHANETHVNEAHLRRMYLETYDVNAEDPRSELSLTVYEGHPVTVTELWDGTELNVRTLDEVMFAFLTKDWE